MTWFSLTPLVFLTPYVWDSAAHFVRKSKAAVSGEETSAAVSSPGTVVVSVADGCLPAEQPAVPANDLGSALTGAGVAA